MEQKSDVEYRVEKLYKNSREKFGYLIREVVSNAIHAVIIRKNLNQQEGYIPRVEFAVTSGEGSVEIVVKDNGEGFNQSNCHYFTHLDTKNSQKEKLHFHPQGQGRLSVVFFLIKQIIPPYIWTILESFREELLIIQKNQCHCLMLKNLKVLQQMKKKQALF